MDFLLDRNVSHFEGSRSPILMRKSHSSPRLQRKNVHWSDSLEEICYIPSRASTASCTDDLKSYFISTRTTGNMDSKKLRKEYDLYLVDELLADLV